MSTPYWGDSMALKTVKTNQQIKSQDAGPFRFPMQEPRVWAPPAREAEYWWMVQQYVVRGSLDTQHLASAAQASS
jgi:hypothetical protein